MTGDPLARVAPVARAVVADVDRALATLGAPPDHPVWTVLRQVGATVGDAVDALSGLDPRPHAATAQSLRDQARTYAGVRLPTADRWRGVAAQGYERQAAALTDHLAGTGRSMAVQLEATAAYLDAVADWCRHARDDLARALAEALTSAQVVRLREPAGDDTAAVLAAADLATHVLRAVAGVIAQGEALHDAWRGRLDALGPPAGYGPADAVAATGVLEVGP